jgi:hypothetical protein
MSVCEVGCSAKVQVGGVERQKEAESGKGRHSLFRGL